MFTNEKNLHLTPPADTMYQMEKILLLYTQHWEKNQNDHKNHG